MRVSIAIELTWKAHCLCVEAPRSWEQSERVRAFWGVHGTSTPNTLQVHARLCAQSHGAKALPSEIALRSLSLQRSQVPNAHDMGHAIGQSCRSGTERRHRGDDELVTAGKQVQIY